MIGWRWSHWSVGGDRMEVVGWRWSGIGGLMEVVG